MLEPIRCQLDTLLLLYPRNFQKKQKTQQQKKTSIYAYYKFQTVFVCSCCCCLLLVACCYSLSAALNLRTCSMSEWVSLSISLTLNMPNDMSSFLPFDTHKCGKCYDSFLQGLFREYVPFFLNIYYIICPIVPFCSLI